MIMQPEYVAHGLFEQALAETRKKKFTLGPCAS
jgi:hypothetical protein